MSSDKEVNAARIRATVIMAPFYVIWAVVTWITVHPDDINGIRLAATFIAVLWLGHLFLCGCVVEIEDMTVIKCKGCGKDIPDKGGKLCLECITIAADMNLPGIDPLKAYYGDKIPEPLAKLREVLG